MLGFQRILHIDVEDCCTHCGNDTSAGTRLYDERIEYQAHGSIIFALGSDSEVLAYLSGYLCKNCQDNEML